MRNKLVGMFCFYLLLIIPMAYGRPFTGYSHLSPYQYRLAIGAIFRDEARYLREWIEFHRLVGVEHFILCNHLSIDNYHEVLQPYISEGIVELIDWPYDYTSIYEWNSIQCRAYMHIVEKAKKNVQWLAILDTDEFLFPVQEDNLATFLQNYQKMPGLGVNWVVFGTSKTPHIAHNQLMIEKLTRRCNLDHPINRHIKSIVQPICVKSCGNPHFFSYVHNTLHINSNFEQFSGPIAPHAVLDAIRINHYSYRDEDFCYNHKVPRLQKWNINTSDLEAKMEVLNAESDVAIQRFVPELKQRMGFDG